MKQVISSDKAPKAIGPYSQAVLAGNCLFISGQIPINPADGTIESRDIDMQTRQVMSNIQEILKEANMDFEDVVKADVFLVDLNDFDRFNHVYKQYFDKWPPARTTAQVAGLPKGVKIEISMTAYKET